MSLLGTSPALACDLDAIPPELRQAHQSTTEALFAAAQATRELPDGLALYFANDGALLAQMAKFVAAEQLCCPFLSFHIRVEPGQGRSQLSLTGGPGVKAFLKSEFASLLRS